MRPGILRDLSQLHTDLVFFIFPEIETSRVFPEATPTPHYCVSVLDLINALHAGDMTGPVIMLHKSRADHRGFKLRGIALFRVSALDE